ncbi:kinase-like domain-containing protein [Pisolithus thermaeus]|nr:kinase-like domain-containing protein [Pisolithus thermaeus]
MVGALGLAGVTRISGLPLEKSQCPNLLLAPIQSGSPYLRVVRFGPPSLPLQHRLRFSSNKGLRKVLVSVRPAFKTKKKSPLLRLPMAPMLPNVPTQPVSKSPTTSPEATADSALTVGMLALPIPAMPGNTRPSPIFETQSASICASTYTTACSIITSLTSQHSMSPLSSPTPQAPDRHSSSDLNVWHQSSSGIRSPPLDRAEIDNAISVDRQGRIISIFRTPLSRQRKEGEVSSPSGNPSVTASLDVNLDQFKVLKHLGSGSMGHVFKVRDRVSGKCLALKVIKKGLGDDYAVREQQAFVRNAGNTHAIQLAASFHDTENFYMAMSLQVRGDLQQLISSMRVLSLDLARFYAAELIVGLYALHTRGIIHRDIKPENLLIDKGGHILISDFGLAVVFDIPGSVPPYVGNGWVPQAPYIVRESCGTLDFMAPEMLLKKGYGFAVDYWAAGITIFTMLLGRPPWHEVRNERKQISNVCYSPLPRCAVPFCARMSLHRILAKDPKHRLTYNQIIHDPFFSEIDWTAIRMRKAARPASQVAQKVCEGEQFKSVEFSQGSKYTHDYDPYPTFTWLSSAMVDRRASPTVYKARAATIRRIRRYLDRGKRIIGIRVYPPSPPTHLETASQTDAAVRRRARAFEVLFGKSSSSCDTPYRYAGLCRELNEVSPVVRVPHRPQRCDSFE